ncbi:putative RTA1-like protein [Mycena venus]|uniref:Putative RTA1-like protein n=1 Tax=Mycena venus TaxID=2733690 RepID=A0A8H7CQ01_9AGAR|nr:putative RTA1-like protein [Mycena venus]
MAPTNLGFSPYGYTPTEYICILFVALFGISTLLHIGQAIHYRMWWLFLSAILAGILETVGWGGRLWSSKSPQIFEAYEIQIVCTVIGVSIILYSGAILQRVPDRNAMAQPTPLAAANFIVLGRIINRLGPVYSRLSPKLYTLLFLCCDIVSLIVQAVGGGMAATAVNENRDPTKGGNIILGGIVFQMVTITVYVLCATEFLLRYLRNRPIGHRLEPAPSTTAPLGRKMKVLVYALAFNTTCLFIRAVYRVIELSDGWSGRIITTQVYFNVLDGAMITLAILTLNVAHPGQLLAAPTPDGRVSKDGGIQDEDEVPGMGKT